MRSLPSADHHTDFGDAVGWLADMHRPHVFGDNRTPSIEPSLSPGGIPGLKLSVDRRFGPAQQLGDWSSSGAHLEDRLCQPRSPRTDGRQH